MGASSLGRGGPAFMMTPSQLPSIGTSDVASSLAVDGRLFARRSTVAYISGGHPVLPLPLQLAQTVHPIPRHLAHRIGLSSRSRSGHAMDRSAAPAATPAASCAASVAAVDAADAATRPRRRSGTGRDVDDAPGLDATRAAAAMARWMMDNAGQTSSDGTQRPIVFSCQCEPRARRRGL